MSNVRNFSRVSSLILSCGVAVVAIDQWTKQIVLEKFANEGESHPFLSWWSFTLVHNHGAAFGIFRNLPDSIRTAFFVLLPLLVLGALWWFYIRRFEPEETLGPVAMGFVFGGAIGNLIDRLRHGFVIDFIDWFYPTTGSCLPQFHKFTPTTCHWPVFNVADVAISSAMVLLILHSFRQDSTPKQG
ncbi:MAG: signal peptidase II [Bdellovibrionales bacterium]|nr:signal peptidase II [Bdellovibrionales bacterium]